MILLGAGFLLSVDFSILNVALPEVGGGVGLGPTELPWIASAYALPAAGCSLLFGRLADLFGRRGLLLSGPTQHPRSRVPGDQDARVARSARICSAARSPTAMSGRCSWASRTASVEVAASRRR